MCGDLGSGDGGGPDALLSSPHTYSSVQFLVAILALFVYLCSKSLCCLSPDTLNKVLFNVGGEEMTVTLLIAQFLFVWTGAGAVVATFGVPGGGCFSKPSETANG